jgi:hypothetical protein
LKEKNLLLAEPQNGLMATFYDIRFTDDDETTELEYWIESAVTSGTSKLATVWVKVKDSLETANQDIYIYYGKSGASDGSDGPNTFNFFDDFVRDNSADVGNGWTEDDNIGSIENNQLKLLASDQGGYVYSVNKAHGLSAGRYLFETRMKPNGIDAAAEYFYYHLFGDTTNKRSGWRNYCNNLYYDSSGGWIDSGTNASSGVWHIEGIDYDFDSDIVKTYMIDRLSEATDETPYANDSKNGKVTFGVGGLQGEAQYIDWILVRKHATTPPAWYSDAAEKENPWGTASDLIASNGKTGMSNNMSAVSDSSGYVHLAYIDSNSKVQYKKSTCNGVPWTARTPDGSYSDIFYGVAYDGSGLWTAVGVLGEIQTSPDGTTWTAQTPDGSYADNFREIAHDGSGLWTAVGQTGEIQTSPNGTDWTAQTPADSYADNFWGIAHNGSGLWTAVGQTGEIQTSPNGTDWTAQTPDGIPDTFYGVAYDGSGLWIAVGNSGEIQTSSDGITWIARTSGFAGTFYGVAHDGSGLWTAVGQTGEIQTSPNGIDWTARTPDDNYTGIFHGIAHDGSGLWTAVGASGEIQTSSDGITWAARDPGSSYASTFRGIAHDGSGLWTAVGETGEIQTRFESWRSRVELDVATCAYPSIAIDTTGNNGLYAFWIRDNNVYYKRGCSPWASGDWGTLQTLEAAGGNSNDWVSAGYSNFGTAKVFAEWTQGSGSPYSIKWQYVGTTACSAASPTLTFAISGDNAITFSNLNTASPRWAGDSAGSESESSAHNLTASTNSSSGYTITVRGDTLKDGGNSITAIGDPAASVASGGTKQFGIRITSAGGNCAGSQVSPYNGASNMYGYNATATTNDEIVSFLKVIHRKKIWFN